MKISDISGAIDVKLDDLFIFQDNSDADQKFIDALSKKESHDPVIVARLTPSVKRGLEKIRSLHQTSEHHKKYLGLISDDLLKTNKKYILLDGNHRYLAARKSGSDTIKAESDTDISAEDIVNFMQTGEF